MKIDLKKDRPELYRPGTREFVEVDVPATTYLAVDGHGDPNTSPDYVTALETLYPVAYGVRSAHRARIGDDFVVGPLEGLWSSADPSAFTAGRKQDWDWTMIIPLPDGVTVADIDDGRASTLTRRPTLPIDRVRTLELVEGRSLQIMHVGPYDAEGPTLARLHHEVMPSRGLTWNGPHHEIYLSDPRRTAPERLRTVLRQPVRPIS